jgi:hypothetical protein
MKIFSKEMAGGWGAQAGVGGVGGRLGGRSLACC